MRTHEKTIKVSMLVFSDVGGKRMPFSSFLPWAGGDLSPSTESCICCVVTRAGIKVSVWLVCGFSSPPLLLPAAFCWLRNPLCPLLVSGCASDTGQRGLTALGGNYTRDKLGELCMQIVGQRKGCSRWETRLAAHHMLLYHVLVPGVHEIWHFVV